MVGLGDAFNLVGDALRLRADFAHAVVTMPGVSRVAVIVVILAGLSEAFGESVILFLNHVSPRRFLLSLLISAIIFAATYFFLAASIWAVARVGFRAEVGFADTASVVALAQAPRLFGFLVFFPYFGLPISVLLLIWSLLATTLAVAEVFVLGPLQTAATMTLGGVLFLTLQRTVGRPLLALARVARRRVSGVDLITDRELLRQLVDGGPDTGLAPPRPQRVQMKRGARKP